MKRKRIDDVKFSNMEHFISCLPQAHPWYYQTSRVGFDDEMKQLTMPRGGLLLMTSFVRQTGTSGQHVPWEGSEFLVNH